MYCRETSAEQDCSCFIVSSECIPVTPLGAYLNIIFSLLQSRNKKLFRHLVDT